MYSKKFGYLCHVKNKLTSLSPKSLLLILVIISIISTLHIWFHYQCEIVAYESFYEFRIPDSLDMKEVGFIDFVFESVRRIFATMV